MKFRLLLILILSIFLSCKSFKEQRSCKQRVSKHESLEIKSYEELLNYLEIDSKQRKPFNLIILDGTSIAKDSLNTFIEDQEQIKIISASILRTSDGTCLDCPRTKLALILTTNDCLFKTKSRQ